MTIIGVDLGVRTVHVVGIEDDLGTFSSAKLDVARASRYEELRPMSLEMCELALEGDLVFIEEPPLAGMRNIRTFGQLSMTAGAILSATSAQGYLVPVSTWKKATVGSGNADKAAVAAWLERTHPDIHALCDGDQNFVDASCIALYGLQAHQAATRIAGASPGDLDLPL